MNSIEVLELRIATMPKGEYRDALIKRREILKWIRDGSIPAAEQKPNPQTPLEVK